MSLYIFPPATPDNLPQYPARGRQTILLPRKMPDNSSHYIPPEVARQFPFAENARQTPRLLDSAWALFNCFFLDYLIGVVWYVNMACSGDRVIRQYGLLGRDEYTSIWPARAGMIYEQAILTYIITTREGHIDLYSCRSSRPFWRTKQDQ